MPNHRLVSLFLSLILPNICYLLPTGYLPQANAQEEITITTYYPSPYGSYKELTTTDNTYLATNSGSVGIGTTSPEFKLTVDNDGGIIAKGTFGSGASLATAGAGTRFIWYPRKAAFRAGNVSANYWDNPWVGNYSVAFGQNTNASGAGSTAIGYGSWAEGNWSTATGDTTWAGGDVSTAMGSWTRAEDSYSFALGRYADAKRFSSMVLGSGVDASNHLVNNIMNSLAVGFNSTIPTLFIGSASGVGTIGKVGIGTTSPQCPLHITDTADHSPSILIERRSTGGMNANSTPRLGLVDTAVSPNSVTGSPAWFIDNSNDNFRVFRQPNITTSGTTFLKIDNNGNLWGPGIGAAGGGLKFMARNQGNVFSLDWESGGLGTVRFYVDNTAVAALSGNKSFIINHPLDSSKYLVHATLEGPEGAVYYRGTAKLTNGAAEITLPAYFEALTSENERTILLTNIDGFDKLAVKKVNGKKIDNAKFIVYSDNPDSMQEFDWEVKAVRKDTPPLAVEPDKNAIEVRGFGPYTYAVGKP